MKSWEHSRNIVAFFQSFPNINQRIFSFFSTIICNDQILYQSYRSSYNNPELKSDPFEILEEIIEFMKLLNKPTISIDLMTNVDYHSSMKHQLIYDDYIVPMLQILSKYVKIQEMREYSIDLLSLKGLYQHSTRKLIPDVVNTVISI